MPPCLLLNETEMLRVLSSTCICYAAFAQDDQPYVLPLAFTITGGGAILLHIRTGGRAHGMLLGNPRVCLAFSLLDEDCVDSVLLCGAAVLASAGEDGSLPVTIHALSLSGRRYPLHTALP